MTGVVADASGASLPGATVTATESGTTLRRVAVTAADGGYSLAGYQGVRVATGVTTRLDAALQVGALSETMTVTADASRRRGATASLGQVVDSGTITGLPLNGRSFVSLTPLPLTERLAD